MIKIDDERCEFHYRVDTKEKKFMHKQSPMAFELSSISEDVQNLMLCIDSKYGKGCALRMFGMIVAHIYTDEDLEQADKEINGNE